MIVPHNQLRIDENITREDKRTKHAIDDLNGAVERDEHSHEPEQDHEPQRAEQVRHPVGEVILGLACEEGQSDEDSKRQCERLHHYPRVVERCRHAD